MPADPLAAVAIIRVRAPQESVLLLRRNSNPRDPWSGHFSFPGGRKDDTDSSLLATCMRETQEETGIILTPEAMCAILPASYAGSRTEAQILVQPYLFQLDTRPPLELDHREIESSCWLDLARFRQKELHVSAEVLPHRITTAFPIDDYYLWGFTYKLLTRVLETSGPLAPSSA